MKYIALGLAAMVVASCGHVDYVVVGSKPTNHHSYEYRDNRHCRTEAKRTKHGVEYKVKCRDDKRGHHRKH